MTKFMDSLDSKTKDDKKKIESAFRDFCKGTKKDDNRFVSHNMSYLPFISPFLYLINIISE